MDATPAYHNPHLAVHDYDDCLHRNIKKNLEFVQIGSESQSVRNIQRLLIKACTVTWLVAKESVDQIYWPTKYMFLSIWNLKWFWIYISYKLIYYSGPSQRKRLKNWLRTASTSWRSLGTPPLALWLTSKRLRYDLPVRFIVFRCAMHLYKNPVHSLTHSLSHNQFFPSPILPLSL